MIERVTRPEQRVPIDFKVATLPIHRGLDTVQSALFAASRLPCPPRGPRSPRQAPNARRRWRSSPPRGSPGTTCGSSTSRTSSSPKGTRPALFFAENLTHSLADDELEPGRKKLRLEFELPKGAYATLVVKRVTDAA